MEARVRRNESTAMKSSNFCLSGSGVQATAAEHVGSTNWEIRPRMVRVTALMASMSALIACSGGDKANSFKFDAPSIRCKARSEACLNKCVGAKFALLGAGKSFKLHARDGKTSLKTTERQDGVILSVSVIVMGPRVTSIVVAAAWSWSWQSSAELRVMKPAANVKRMLTLKPPNFILLPVDEKASLSLSSRLYRLEGRMLVPPVAVLGHLS